MTTEELSGTRPARQDGPDASVALAELAARAGDFDQSTLDMTRLDILDTLGCAVAARAEPGVTELAGLVRDWGGTALSSAWGTGLRAAPDTVAMANATRAHALDYDDMHPGVSHTAASVVPAALAIAEAHRVTDLGPVVDAVLVGTEVADRIAVSVTDGPGVTGWLLTPLVGYFGAAAAAGRLLGLDPPALRHALGIAYAQASGNGQATLDGALTKRMQPGFAARGGVLAAELAARGVTGALDSLEGRRGFFAVYHRGRYDPAALRRPAGAPFHIRQATFKPYPCCGWTHAALECALRLRERGVAAGDVRAVQVGVNAQAYASTGRPTPRRHRPRTVVDAQFSIPYVVAVALVTGSVGLADFTADALDRPEVVDLAARVTVRVDERIQARYGRVLSPARVRADLSDGGVADVEVLAPRGTQDRALTRAEVMHKFVGCCRHGGWTGDDAQAVADLVLHGHAGAVTALSDRLREAA